MLSTIGGAGRGGLSNATIDEFGVKIGELNTATTDNTLLIGSNNVIQGHDNVTFGFGNTVRGNQNIILGNKIPPVTGNNNIILSTRIEHLDPTIYNHINNRLIITTPTFSANWDLSAIGAIDPVINQVNVRETITDRVSFIGTRNNIFIGESVLAPIIMIHEDLTIVDNIFISPSGSSMIGPPGTKVSNIRSNVVLGQGISTSQADSVLIGSNIVTSGDNTKPFGVNTATSSSNNVVISTNQKLVTLGSAIKNSVVITNRDKVQIPLAVVSGTAPNETTVTPQFVNIADKFIYQSDTDTLLLNGNVEYGSGSTVTYAGAVAMNKVYITDPQVRDNQWSIAHRYEDSEHYLDFSTVTVSNNVTTEVLKASISSAIDTTRICFTGQHLCSINETSIASLQIGYLVSATGHTHNTDDTRHPTFKESLPVVKLTNIDRDINVFGVYVGMEDRTATSRCYKFGCLNMYQPTTGIEDSVESEFVPQRYRTSCKPIHERRVKINSSGEGVIYVNSSRGKAYPGALLCSSAVAGQARVQGTDLIYAHTIAKATSSLSIDKLEGLVGCVYLN